MGGGRNQLDFRSGGSRSVGPLNLAASRPMASQELQLMAVAVGLLAAFCGGQEDRPQPPLIQSPPVGLTVMVCGDAKFSVAVSGDPPFRFQWNRSGSPVPGETSDSMTLQGVVPSDDGQVFSVTVTNRAGTVVSAGAVLHVETLAPIPPTLELSSRAGWRIAANGSTVAWTDGTGVFVASALCGRPVRTLFLKSLPLESTAGIAFGADVVVWTDNGMGRVLSAPITGGPATVLANVGGMGPEEIVVAGSDLYWPQPLVGIRRMAANGGPVGTTAVAGSWDDGIAADESYVYWNDLASHTVNKMALMGGSPVVLASGQGYLGGVATDGTFVYWAATDESTTPPTGHIFRIPRDGGVPVSLTSQPAYTLNLALDSGFVYWTASNIRSAFAGSGSVSKAPSDGSALPTTLAAGINPFGVALDSSYVYWTEVDVVGGSPGRVMRMPR